uniref:Aftiphilin clathrin-binding box domain-containing protein n=1 Tax=Clastoptera arizonana TaxID=38151 RepID=A0A1B6D259_9HEMI
MASNIPPLLSSTPPPLCDSDEEEDEEDNEFGMFNTTEELDYNDCPAFQTSNESKVYLSERTMPSETKTTEQDCTSQDSGLCPDSEGMSPTPHSDDERTYVKISASENILTNSFKDNFVNSDSQICKDLSSLSNVENDLVIPENENLEENDLKIPVLESKNLNTNNKITNNEKKEFCLHVIETNLGNENTKDSADFDDFQHLENPSSPDQFIYPSVGLIKNHIEEECESQAITFEKSTLPQTEQSVFNSTDTTSFNKVNIVEDLVLDSVNILEQQENDDDFGDFHFESGNSCSVSYSFENNVNHEHKETFRSVDSEMDEFSDFADFQECNFMSKENLSCEILPNVKSAPLFNEATDFNQDPINQVSEDEDWNKLFPEKSNEKVESTYTNLTVEESNILKKLFPIETSPALSYQWTNSFANKMLLSSLNIDSRNILFMPWCNLSVPRFAANLGVGVLEPVKAPEPLQSTVGFSISTTEESVPDAHFDWSSSGLTNPLDCGSSTLSLCTVLCFIRCLVMVVVGQPEKMYLLSYILTFSPHLTQSKILT